MLIVNPTEKDAKQYKGWPITINQLDNYGRKAVAYLPELSITGIDNPVIQVINEKNNEIIYTIRINGNTFRPKIFETGTYTIKISEPDKQIVKVINSVNPADSINSKVIKINLQK